MYTTNCGIKFMMLASSFTIVIDLITQATVLFTLGKDSSYTAYLKFWIYSPGMVGDFCRPLDNPELLPQPLDSTRILLKLFQHLGQSRMLEIKWILLMMVKTLHHNLHLNFSFKSQFARHGGTEWSFETWYSQLIKTLPA